MFTEMVTYLTNLTMASNINSRKFLQILKCKMPPNLIKFAAMESQGNFSCYNSLQQILLNLAAFYILKCVKNS